MDHSQGLVPIGFLERRRVGREIPDLGQMRRSQRSKVILWISVWPGASRR